MLRSAGAHVLSKSKVLQHDGRIRRLDVQPLVHLLYILLHRVRAPAGVAGDVGDMLPVRAVRQDPDEGVVADAAAQDAGARVEDALRRGAIRGVQADVFLVVADVVDIFRIAFGAVEVWVVIDVHLGL